MNHKNERKKERVKERKRKKEKKEGRQKKLVAFFIFYFTCFSWLYWNGKVYLLPIKVYISTDI